jgi:general stress protein YciG
MSDDTNPEKPKKKRRGFAAMSPEKQKEIASKGGKSAHAKGTAHQFTSEEAREAGTKGGKAAAEKKRQEQEGEGGDQS